MSENQSRPLADLPHHLREHANDFRANWEQFRKDVKEDPAVIWRTQTTRVFIWIFLGVAVLLAARFLINSFAPAGPAIPAERATTLATLYVACVQPNCLKSDVTRQPMSFNEWPLVCKFCGQKSVYRATICSKCHRWFATPPNASKECPHCARAAQSPATKPVASRPANTDDQEDGW